MDKVKKIFLILIIAIVCIFFVFITKDKVNDASVFLTMFTLGMTGLIRFIGSFKKDKNKEE